MKKTDFYFSSKIEVECPYCGMVFDFESEFETNSIHDLRLLEQDLLRVYDCIGCEKKFKLNYKK